MSPLAAPLCITHSLWNSTTCFLRPHLNCHCSCKSPKTPTWCVQPVLWTLFVLSLSHRVPVTPLLVFFCLFGGHLPFSCPCSVVMPDHGAPGSLLSTLSPEVSSLPRVSRFPGPAQISLLNAGSLEANADFLSVADAGHDARHRRSIIRSSSSPSHILLLLCYHLSKWLPPVS